MGCLPVAASSCYSTNAQRREGEEKKGKEGNGAGIYKKDIRATQNRL